MCTEFAAEGEHSVVLFTAPAMTTAIEYYKVQSYAYAYKNTFA